MKTATFVVAAVAVVPLAWLLGEATEQLARHSGPRVGALLNATLGNAAELIIGVFLVAHGELSVVRASITGSIVGNLLLVLGGAFIVGGVRHRELQFSRRGASAQVVSMTLAVAGLLMASVYASGARATGARIEVVSVGVAVVLVALYGAHLVFSLVTHADALGDVAPDAGARRWSRNRALTLMVAAGVGVAVASELVASTLEPAVASLGIPRLWVGLIVLPIVGNAAEHSTAVTFAARGRGQLALDVAVGSSTQIALVVTPLLVFFGAAAGHHLTLVFTPFELAAIAISVVVVAMISDDGRGDWLEGAQLLGVYLILAISSYYVTRG
jgi:Ca2+:H+ antiporter